MKHFGIQLISRGKSFKLVREEFAIINTRPSLPYFSSIAQRGAYVDEQGSAYSKDWCAEYRSLCLKNYDINMEYFSRLDENEFNETLNAFLLKYNRFVEVKDLNTFSGIEGFYVIVLDEYKQVYIGKTKDIKKRIMQHWSKTKPFDRTLLPMYAWDKSVFSIDFFRALDTTRIYAWKKKMSEGIEDKLIRSFSSKFCTNRIGGDVRTLNQALTTMNIRK